MKKCNIAHAPKASTLPVLNSQYLKVLDSMIPKDKKNIATLKLSTEEAFELNKALSMWIRALHASPSADFINLQAK
jgi:hypothetical protein